MRCRKHPRYKGKGKPRLPCAACWWVYFHGAYDNFVPYLELEFDE